MCIKPISCPDGMRSVQTYPGNDLALNFALVCFCSKQIPEQGTVELKTLQSLHKGQTLCNKDPRVNVTIFVY